jgi:hypothetical protein
VNLLIDTSNVVWAGLLHGKDKENGRKVLREDGKKVLVNSAEYGFERPSPSLRKSGTASTISPKDMIFVVEGRNSKRCACRSPTRTRPTA